MTVQIKRVYEPADAVDGYRVLVDRLWPRGLTKERADVDLWLKEIAPSPALRTWWNHDPDRIERDPRASARASPSRPSAALASVARMLRDATLIDWLLDTDPALRWQVERDLLAEPEEVWQATRARVATDGMGAELLAHQDADGQWAGGAYFPAGWDFATQEPGQPYTATTWSLNTLRDWGLDAAALAGTADKLAANARWEYNDLPYWGGEVDCCINAFTLANGAWLGTDVSSLVDWFVEHRLEDGGWNCEWVEGSTRSSFHSTLNVLRGILFYEQATGGSEQLEMARRSGEEYLLRRHLMNRLSSGEQVDHWVTRFVYPFRWFYSVLNAADYFRAAALHDRVAPDPRLADAIAAIRVARRPDGTWEQERRHPGAVWFETDVAPGEPSPWLTLIGTRVLEWWDGAQPA